MEKRKRIIKANLGCACLFIAGILLCGWMTNSLARENQEIKIDLQALVAETQIMSHKANKMTVVWWLPEEFWRASIEQNPGITKAQVEEFLKVLRPYTLMIVIDAEVGPFGGFTYRSEADIRRNLQLKDKQGTYYHPINQDEINPGATNFLLMFKPIIANMLGPLGQNMHVFVFPAKNKKNQKIADPTKEGALWVKLGEKEFRFRLPLGSLLPRKTCPECQESCSGAWNYCPWCGTKLPK